MTKRFNRKLIDSAAIGACISLGFFFLSWWTHTFDRLVFAQFPGFLVCSLLWGFLDFHTSIPIAYEVHSCSLT